MKKKILIFLITIILGLGFVAIKEVKAGPDENVFGWAWSENIGWISFNSTNCDPNNIDRKPYTNTDYSLCPGSYANYGVHIDPNTGLFSGGAWSSNIGWISFGDFDGDGDIDSDDKDIFGSPCAANGPNCEATLNLSTKKVSGWARALAPVDVKYEHYDRDLGEFLKDASYLFYNDVNNSSLKAQTFTTVGNPVIGEHQVDFISLVLRRVGSPGNLIVSIQGVSFGEPNGDIICRAIIGGDILPEVPFPCLGPACTGPSSWIDIFLDNCTLDGPGIEYAILIEAPDSNGVSSSVRWYYTGASYSGGEGMYLDGTDWISDGVDYPFQIWKGDPLQEPPMGRIADTEISFAGGWDGWIKLRGAIQAGGSYGVWLDTNISPHEFRDWAWGGDDTPGQAVVGWVSFNRLNCDPNGDGNPNDGPAQCIEPGRDYSTNPIPDYKVMTGLVFNNRPSAINLKAEQTSGCSSAPVVKFTWDYSDNDNVPPGTDPQSAYEIQISDAGGLIATLSGGSATSQEYAGLDFGTTYSWRVRVQDTKGPIWSEWTNGPNFTPNEWPKPDFTLCPDEPFINETIQFCSVFQSGVCDPAAEPSCNLTADLTTCAAGCNIWEWDFGDNVGTSSEQNPTYSYSSPESHTVRLTVSDLNGKSCSKTWSLSAKIPLPKWREIPPF